MKIFLVKSLDSHVNYLVPSFKDDASESEQEEEVLNRMNRHRPGNYEICGGTNSFDNTTDKAVGHLALNGNQFITLRLEIVS